jgi:hypothetical protein
VSRSVQCNIDYQFAPPEADAAYADAALCPAVWSAVNAALIRKAIVEFAHERLIAPRGSLFAPTFQRSCLDRL